MHTQHPAQIGHSSPDALPQYLRQEIDQLRPQFLELYPSMDIDNAVALWIGKPNRFTQITMHSVQDVLTYMQAEHAEHAARAEAVAPASERTATKHAWNSELHQQAVVRKATVAEATAAWRFAVQQRKDAIHEWDKYVAQKREEMQAAKAQ